MDFRACNRTQSGNQSLCFCCCGFSQKLIALIFNNSERWLHQTYGSRKKTLFSTIKNEVVEIGPGTGINFRYYPPNTKVHAFEPNGNFGQKLKASAKDNRIDLEWYREPAEQLPFGDSSVRAIVSTLVLCSVVDVTTILSEVRRCLQPGGRFYFLEHVLAADGHRSKRAMQHLLTPAWKIIFDGCHLNRDLAKDFQHAGFAESHIESFQIPKYKLGQSLYPFSSHICGYLEA